MSSSGFDNVKLFRKIIDRGFCQGDLSIADEICATKLLEHEYLAKTDVPGPEKFLKTKYAMRAAA